MQGAVLVRLAASAAMAIFAAAGTPAAAEYFHLSQNGVCNKTAQPVPDIWVAMEACEGGDDCTCKVTETDGAGTYANEATLAPGACGTATFELGAGCSGVAVVYVGPDDVECSFQLSVSPTGNKTIENAGCNHSPDFLLEPHDGDEHFQLDIKPKS